MQIYPAIDIQRGRTVHQFAGGIDDPLAVAGTMLAAGASWLHLVDMDRAYGTGGENSDPIRRISRLTGARIQLGGLLRSAEDLDRAADLGAERAVLATATLTQPGLLDALLRAASGLAVAVGIDVRRGRPVLRGSDGRLTESAGDLAARARKAGVPTILYRDLDRDGQLAGLDVSGAAALRAPGSSVLVAGGGSSLEDIAAARTAGLEGVVLGRALYAGRFTLGEAIACSA